MNKKMTYLLVAALLVVAVAGGFVYWFLRDDAPAEVSLEGATAGATSSAASTATGDTATGDTASADGETAASENGGDLSGQWVVDTTTGEFDYERATGTFAGFRIEEELSGIGSTTAVGRTGEVDGTITVEGTVVSEANFEIDLRSLTTNDSRRDDAVASALEVDQFPTATFVLSEPIDFGDAGTTGEPVVAVAVGELTLHGATQSIEMPIEAQLVEDTIVVVGSAGITFADYGVEMPSSPIVLSVEDNGVIELQLLLTRS
jgi:polyisoprenoid-binding protein YceI